MPATWTVETARTTLAACQFDLDSEQQRTQALDGKLTQLAAFIALAIAVSGTVGASVLAAGKLPFGFTIAWGACLTVTGVLWLFAVVQAFRALAPKSYAGIDSDAVIGRVTPSKLGRSEAEVLAEFASGRANVLSKAREINDRKAKRTLWVFWLTGSGFASLIAGLVVTAVGVVTK